MSDKIEKNDSSLKGTSLPETSPSSSEEGSISLSSIIEKVKKWWQTFNADRNNNNNNKDHKDRKDHTEEQHQELSFDLNQVQNLWKKHARWLIPTLLILIAMVTSIYLRTMPLRLPITEEWAENGVTNFYKQQVEQQISQQYPNLPQQNKDSLIEKEWQKIQIENKDVIASQIAELSQRYKSNFQNEEGTLYLLGIDPYYYYYQSANVLENGHPGTDIKDGQLWDYNRLAPVGTVAEWGFHNWFGAMFHRVVNLFTSAPLLETFFYVGTIFAALTVIPGFFIGRRITKNNVGGFFTAMLLATASFFVARTTGETSDTDVYTVFFPVLIACLFLEALAQENKKKRLMFLGLAGIATGVFAFAWTGWWYIAAFILATMILDSLYLLGRQYLHDKVMTLKAIPAKIKEYGASALVYVVVSGVFVVLLTSFHELRKVISGPLGFLYLKSVGVTSYWPNIRTTVAELNTVSFNSVIGQLGGNLLFFLAILGIVLTIARKNQHGKREITMALFLSIWMAAAFFATTKGVRFILQATPVFSIALGVSLGLIWYYASTWLRNELKFQKVLAQSLVIIVLALLLIQPVRAGYEQAYRSVPSIDDGWHDALTKIKNEAPENIIITSWWDFGHWFKAIAERPVTFDGGNQLGWDAHWVGNSLLTEDEEITIGLLRMLNCGQNTASEELDKIINNPVTKIEIIYSIIVQDKPAALKTLRTYGLTAEQANHITQYTHCDAPPEDYYITSEDMVGKAGVWGHFGSWDFRRAVMYQNTKDLSSEQAVQYLMTTFNFSELDARQIHNEVKTSSGDQWISPWPGYQGAFSCNGDNTTLRCPVDMGQGTALLTIDLKSMEAYFQSSDKTLHPNSIVYSTANEIKKKEFTENLVGISVILLPNKQLIVSHPLQAKSMFTQLFFFDGIGLQCFEKFDQRTQVTGGKIVTWKVDFSCNPS